MTREGVMDERARAREIVGEAWVAWGQRKGWTPENEIFDPAEWEPFVEVIAAALRAALAQGERPQGGDVPSTHTTHSAPVGSTDKNVSAGASDAAPSSSASGGGAPREALERAHARLVAAEASAAEMVLMYREAENKFGLGHMVRVQSLLREARSALAAALAERPQVAATPRCCPTPDSPGLHGPNLCYIPAAPRGEATRSRWDWTSKPLLHVHIHGSCVCSFSGQMDERCADLRRALSAPAPTPGEGTAADHV